MSSEFNSLDGSKLYYINRKLNLCMAYTSSSINTTLFDYKLYYAIYPDLANWANKVPSYINALSHYVQYGQYEDRIKSKLDFYDRYPDFNWQYYVSINHLCSCKIQNEWDAIVDFALRTGLALPEHITIRYFLVRVPRNLYLSNIITDEINLTRLRANVLTCNILNCTNINVSASNSGILNPNLIICKQGNITNIICGNLIANLIICKQANITNINSNLIIANLAILKEANITTLNCTNYNINTANINLFNSLLINTSNLISINAYISNLIKSSKILIFTSLLLLLLLILIVKFSL
jgi:hypothetical protein